MGLETLLMRLPVDVSAGHVAAFTQWSEGPKETQQGEPCAGAEARAVLTFCPRPGSRAPTSRWIRPVVWLV